MITDKMHNTYNEILAEIRKHPTCMMPAHKFHDRNTAEHIEAVTFDAREHVRHIGEIGVLTAMFHDLGKLETHNEGTFRKHDAASERIARENGLPEMACRVIGLHSWVYNIDQVSPKGVRKFVRRLTDGLDPQETVTLYLDLMEADAHGFSPAGYAQRMKDYGTFKEKVALAMTELGMEHSKRL